MFVASHIVIEKLSAVFASKSLLEIGGDECDNLNFMNCRNDSFIIHEDREL